MSSLQNKTARKFLAYPFCEIKTADPKAKVFDWIDNHWHTQRFVQRIPLKYGELPPPLNPPTEPDNDDIETSQIDPKLQPLPSSHNIAQRQLALYNQAQVHRQFSINHLSQPQRLSAQQNIRLRPPVTDLRRLALERSSKNMNSSPPEYMISRQSSRPSAVLFPMPTRFLTSNIDITPIPEKPVTLFPIQILIPAPILVKCAKPIIDKTKIMNSKELFPMPYSSSENESPLSSPPLIISPPPATLPVMTYPHPKPILKKSHNLPGLAKTNSQKRDHFGLDVCHPSGSIPISTEAAAWPSSSPPLMNLSPVPLTLPAVQYPPPSILKHSKSKVKSHIQPCKAPVVQPFSTPSFSINSSAVVTPLPSPPQAISPEMSSPSPSSMNTSPVKSSTFSRPIVILKRPNNANKTILPVPPPPVSTHQKKGQQHNVYQTFNQRRTKL